MSSLFRLDRSKLSIIEPQEMAAPGFGFSVGDFVAGVTLVRKLIRALNDSAGARASYRRLISELFDLDNALTGVSSLQLSPAQSAQKIALVQVASQCQLSITSFLDRNAKFEGSLSTVSGEHSSSSKWQASLHKIQWALCKDSAIQALRAEIRAHTTTLNLLLSTIQIASANMQNQAVDTCWNLAQRTQAQTGETVALTKQNHQLLTFQADQIASISSNIARFVDSHEKDTTETNDLRLLVANVMESNMKILTAVLRIQQHSSNLPPQVDRQQPIVFEDAHGRIAPFHVEFINTFAVFQAVLEARFRDVPGLKKVKSLEYALQDVASRRKIDLTKSWESIFRPGRRVNMSVVFSQISWDQAQSPSCPACSTENAVEEADTDADIQCANTRCGIWYRRITELDTGNLSVERNSQDEKGIDVADCNIEAESQDEIVIDERDTARDFRRVEILHLPIHALGREDFLQVFSGRIDEAFREWLKLLERLESTVKRHRPECVLNSSSSVNRQKTGPERILLLHRHSEWISSMDTVTTDVSRQLSATLTAWDGFEERCSKYSLNDEVVPSEISVGHTFSKIKLLKDRLEQLKNELRADRAKCDGQENGRAQSATRENYNNWFQSLWR